MLEKLLGEKAKHFEAACAKAVMGVTCDVSEYYRYSYRLV